MRVKEISLRKKSIDGHFIGPVQDTGHGPADLTGFIGKADGREFSVVRREKFQAAQGLPIDGFGAADRDVSPDR